jgi:limonene-1,2-epoxide hydrolase
MTNLDIINAFGDAWASRDLERVMAFFAPGAVYHNIPMEPLTTDAAIRGFIGPFLGMSERIEFKVHHQVANGALVLNERTDYFDLKNGKKIEIRVMGIYELDGGRIVRWRDYFDMKELERQMA